MFSQHPRVKYLSSSSSFRFFFFCFLFLQSIIESLTTLQNSLCFFFFFPKNSICLSFFDIWGSLTQLRNGFFSVFTTKKKKCKMCFGVIRSLLIFGQNKLHHFWLILFSKECIPLIRYANVYTLFYII